MMLNRLLLLIYLVIYLSSISRSSYIYFTTQILLICIMVICKIQSKKVCLPKVSYKELLDLYATGVKFKSNISSIIKAFWQSLPLSIKCGFSIFNSFFFRKLLLQIKKHTTQRQIEPPVGEASPFTIKRFLKGAFSFFFLVLLRITTILFILSLYKTHFLIIIAGILFGNMIYSIMLLIFFFFLLFFFKKKLLNYQLNVYWHIVLICILFSFLHTYFAVTGYWVNNNILFMNLFLINILLLLLCFKKYNKFNEYNIYMWSNICSILIYYINNFLFIYLYFNEIIIKFTKELSMDYLYKMGPNIDTEYMDVQTWGTIYVSVVYCYFFFLLFFIIWLLKLNITSNWLIRTTLLMYHLFFTLFILYVSFITIFFISLMLSNCWIIGGSYGVNALWFNCLDIWNIEWFVPIVEAIDKNRIYYIGWNELIQIVQKNSKNVISITFLQIMPEWSNSISSLDLHSLTNVDLSNLLYDKLNINYATKLSLKGFNLKLYGGCVSSRLDSNFLHIYFYFQDSFFESFSYVIQVTERNIDGSTSNRLFYFTNRLDARLFMIRDILHSALHDANYSDNLEVSDRNLYVKITITLCRHILWLFK